MRRLAALLILLGGCAAPERKDAPNPAEAEVLDAVRAMYADLSARRWDAFEAHFLPEASLTFAGNDGPRKQSAAEFIRIVGKKLEGKEIFSERMKEGSARVHGNVAHVWSKFEGQEGSTGQVRTWSGVDAYTLFRTAGRWKIAAIAVSYDP